jgi:hypothetical protein
MDEKNTKFLKLKNDGKSLRQVANVLDECGKVDKQLKVVR